MVRCRPAYDSGQLGDRPALAGDRRLAISGSLIPLTAQLISVYLGRVRPLDRTSVNTPEQVPAGRSWFSSKAEFAHRQPVWLKINLDT